MSPQASIAHYRITSKLGEGGMGEVWRATDTKLNREVAIKVLPDSVAADTDRLARFQREAQVLASLNHPNIAAIYGVEERAIVMELVEGLEPRGPITEAEALPIVQQLIDALEYAHDRGVIHRDLKPANLKITPDGRLKVLDFGLAKALSNDAPASDPANSPTLTIRATMVGVIMGTAAYMSPEQARGHAVDRRADIWAFGVVLYELLTGKSLFEGATVSDTLAAVLTRDADLTAIPARFQRLLRLCLARDVRQRLSHISGARLLLEEAPAAAKRSRVPWMVAALAVVSLVGAVLWRAPRAGTAPMMRLSVDLGREAQPDQRTGFTLSPDGRRIVYVAHNAEGRRVLATRRFSDRNVEMLRGTEGAFDPFFSPDGEWVGFFADTQLKKVPLNGGSAVVLSDVTPSARGATWGEDGTIVLAASPSEGLARISVSGGALQPLTNPASKGQMTHRWPQFLPGGRKILMTAHATTVGFNSAEIDVLDVGSGQWQTVVRGGFFGRYLPSGHLVYIRDGSLFAVRFDLRSLKAEGIPAPVLDDVAANEVTASGRFDFTSTGALAYMSGTPDAVPSKPVWLDTAGTVEPAPKAGALSLDGRLIAYSTQGIGAQNISIWDTQREVSTAITSDKRDNVSVVFAPDGRHLAFGSFAGGQRAIRWARVDGAGAPKELLTGDKEMRPASFSPDGRYLAYGLMTAVGDSDVMVLPIDLTDPENPKAGTPEPFLQTPATEVRPAFSPDGRWIAYTSNEAGGYEVFVRPFHGGAGRWQISAGDGSTARWSRAGRQIIYTTSAGQLMAVDYEVRGDTFLPGKPRRWTEIAIGANMGRPTFEVAPDGKRVLTTVSQDARPDQNSTVHLTLLLNFFDELKRRMP